MWWRCVGLTRPCASASSALADHAVARSSPATGRDPFTSRSRISDLQLIVGAGGAVDEHGHRIADSDALASMRSAPSSRSKRSKTSSMLRGSRLGHVEDLGPVGATQLDGLPVDDCHSVVAAVPRRRPRTSCTRRIRYWRLPVGSLLGHGGSGVGAHGIIADEPVPAEASLVSASPQPVLNSARQAASMTNYHRRAGGEFGIINENHRAHARKQLPQLPLMGEQRVAAPCSPIGNRRPHRSPRPCASADPATGSRLARVPWELA
jgi:hypothetical protein